MSSEPARSTPASFTRAVRRSAVVEQLMDARIGDRLAGDLRQATEEIVRGELARLAAEEGGHTDDLTAVDEREVEDGPVPPGEVLLALAAADARVGREIGDDDRLALGDRECDEGEVGEVPGRPLRTPRRSARRRRSRGRAGVRPRRRRCRTSRPPPAEHMRTATERSTASRSSEAPNSRPASASVRSSALRSLSSSSSRALPNAPATAWPTLRAKSTCSAKSRGWSSYSSMMPTRRSSTSNGIDSWL